MIVRTWSARADTKGAAAYRSYFEGTLLPDLRHRPGFAGAYLLGDELEGRVALTVLTFWETEEAIRAFAGEHIDTAVVEPEARRHLLEIDPFAAHATLLVDARP